jgi:hypothetical protein
MNEANGSFSYDEQQGAVFCENRCSLGCISLV